MHRVKGTLVPAPERCHHCYHEPLEKPDGFVVISFFKGNIHRITSQNKLKDDLILNKRHWKEAGKTFPARELLREDFKNSAPQRAIFFHYSQCVDPAKRPLNALTQTAVEWGRRL